MAGADGSLSFQSAEGTCSDPLCSCQAFSMRGIHLQPKEGDPFFGLLASSQNNFPLALWVKHHQ